MHLDGNVEGVDSKGLDTSGKQVMSGPATAELVQAAFATRESAESQLLETQKGEYFVVRTDRVTPARVPALSDVEPKAVGIQIDNIASRIRLVPGACGGWPGAIQNEFTETGLLATVVFSGSFPASCGEKHRALSVFDGPRFTESILRWAWSESGGTLRGKVRAGTVPAGAKLFYRAESEPLANLVRDMNKNSNNVFARHIFLALSAERGSPGEAGASARIVREWLAAKRIDARDFAIENGAGLARGDRISAAAITSLLRSAWASPVMPELASSLPVFATDGTLKSRPAGGAAGQAHLKGGTLNGVQSIAGYVLDREGRRFVVAMIVNHANANAAQPAMDALVEWVHDGRP